MSETENKTVQVLETLPDLHKLDESPIDLASEYWTPENKDEYKVGLIVGIIQSTYTEEGSDETVDLPCVIFLSQEKNGTILKMRNGSKRLVATIENAISSGEITPLETPVKISYAGKKKNSTNQFKSDRWSVKTLILSK